MTDMYRGKPRKMHFKNDKTGEVETFDCAVFRVRTFDNVGRPVLCELIQDDQIIHLSDDKDRNHFIVGYINECHKKPDTKKEQEGE